MKRKESMKKIILALSIGILMASSSFAQSATQQEKELRSEHRQVKKKGDKKSPEERAAQKTQKLSKQLALNESQEKKLLALNLEQARQMQAQRTNHAKGDRRSPEQRQEMKASREKWNNGLKDILTNEQYAQYQQQRQEMKAHRKSQHQGNQEHSQKANG